jgi:hypothetical protein
MEPSRLCAQAKVLADSGIKSRCCCQAWRSWHGMDPAMKKDWRCHYTDVAEGRTPGFHVPFELVFSD